MVTAVTVYEWPAIKLDESKVTVLDDVTVKDLLESVLSVTVHVVLPEAVREAPQA